MNKKFLNTIIILIILIAIGVLGYFTLVMQKQSIAQLEEKIVYVKYSHDEENNEVANLIISNIDGSERRELMNRLQRVDFFFIPESYDVIVINHKERVIEKINIDTGLEVEIATFSEIGIDFIGDRKKPLISSDNKNLIFTGGNGNITTTHPKVVVFNFEDVNFSSQLIYENQDLSLSLRYIDSNGKIYASHHAHLGLCEPTEIYPLVTLDIDGENFQKGTDLYSNLRFSPNKNYAIAVEEHKEGPFFPGMCGRYGNGILKLYSVVDDSFVTIENNKLKEFNYGQRSFPKWTDDSLYIIYETFSFPNWSGNQSDQKFGNKLSEGFVIYDINTREKLYKNSLQEVQNWMITQGYHDVRYYPETELYGLDKRALYVDNIIIDYLEDSIGGVSLPFEFLGIIKL